MHLENPSLMSPTESHSIPSCVVVIIMLASCLSKISDPIIALLSTSRRYISHTQDPNLITFAITLLKHWLERWSMLVGLYLPRTVDRVSLCKSNTLLQAIIVQCSSEQLLLASSLVLYIFILLCLFALYVFFLLWEKQVAFETPKRPKKVKRVL